MQGMAMKLTILRVVLIPLFIVAFYWHPRRGDSGWR